MKHNLFNLFFLICFIALIGCDDDKYRPENSDKENPDTFSGSCNVFTFGQETSEFEASDFILHILAPNGEIIQRKGTHKRTNGKSELKLIQGLNDEKFRLLYMEYDIPTPENSRHTKARFGLGCEVNIINGTPIVLDNYNPQIKLFALHSSENTYTINCDEDLLKLANAVNVDDSNIGSDLEFTQTCDIDMDYICYKINKNYGWNPIGANNNTPFKATYNGNNHKITGLTIDRPNTYGIGLFGYTSMAYIKNVHITNSEIRGDYATGSLVGVITRPGNIKASTVIDCCSVSNSIIERSTFSSDDDGVNIGGLVGVIEEGSSLNLTTSSSTDNTIKATYNAGGLVGGSVSYTVAYIGNCTSENNNITAQISGAGGIIAVADSLYISACSNSSAVTGGTSTTQIGIGTGGIVGGSGTSYITACTNSGTIIGNEGVGGIIGSTRIKGSRNPEAPEPFVHNYTMLRYCGNTGAVSGNIMVGGACGDANFGCFATYNNGKIAGEAQVGGILGAGEIAVVHNAINTGEITVDNYNGNSFCGGIIGKADLTSIALCHNYGKVNSSGTHTAGIIGIAGTTSVIHQCGNFAQISSAGGATGGIAGEIGNPSEWGPINTAEVIIGTLEIVMSVAGPAMAYIEHETTGFWHIFLKIAEPAVEYVLVGVNSYFEYHNIHTILHHEALEQIDAAVNGNTTIICDNIVQEIENLRKSFPTDLDVNGFNSSILTDNYIQEINNTLTYYTTKNGSEVYNNNINLKRNELCDEVEEELETKELVHTIIGGIALGASFIFTTGALVAGFFTGGATASAVFVGLGAATSIISGINSIYKGMTEFEQNAVIVSQCVNAAKITSSSANETGGLVGVLNDYGIMRDCLNTANGGGNGGHFIGTAGDKSNISRCLSIAETGWTDYIARPKQKVLFSDLYALSDNEGHYLGGKGISADKIANASSYDNWDIGADKNRWTIPTDKNSFPIPFFSEMRE
jgi:hypothetical protein